MRWSLALCACQLLLAVGVKAQSPAVGGTSRPSPPSTPPDSITWDARDAGFAAWRAAGAGGVVAAPYDGLELDRYVVLVQSAVARERGEGELADSLRGVLSECRDVLQLTAADVARAADAGTWQAFDSAAAGQPLVAVTIVPAVRRSFRDGCISREAERLLLEAGLVTALDTLGYPRDNVSAVEVFIGGTQVEPALIGSAPVTRLAPGYVGPDGLFAIRVYLSAENLAPRDSILPLLKLKIYNSEQARPIEAAFPLDFGDLLRHELLAWRARRLSGGASGAALPIALPPPSNAALLESRISFESGAYVDATAQAVARLGSRRRLLTRHDRLTSGIQVGATFAELGDEAAARMILRDVVSIEPCLTLTADAPARTAALLDELRPATRCAGRPAGEIVRLGLVPGRAHRRLRPGYRGAGLLPAALVLGTAVASVVLHLDADKLQQEHERVVGDPAPSFAIAQDAHKKANLVGLATYAVWGGTIAHAVWREWRLTKRAESVQEYGGSPRQVPAIDVGAAPQGVGLSIYFFR